MIRRIAAFDSYSHAERASLVQTLCNAIHGLTSPDVGSYESDNEVTIGLMPGTTAIVAAHLHQVGPGTFWQLLATSDGAALVHHTLVSASTTMKSAGARYAYISEYELRDLADRQGMSHLHLLLDQAAHTYAVAWRASLAGRSYPIQVPIMSV